MPSQSSIWRLVDWWLIVGELRKLAIEPIFPFLHGFREELLHEDMVSFGIAHGLDLLGNHLSSRCLSEAKSSLVGTIGSIDVAFVWDKVYTPPEDVHMFMNPSSVDFNV